MEKLNLMDIQKLIREAPTDGLTAQEYIQKLWEGCNDEDHFFTYLMQTMHFVAHDYPVMPEMLTVQEQILHMINCATPEKGEFYNVFMSTIATDNVGVCFGVETDPDGRLRLCWYNVVQMNGWLFALNVCREKASDEPAKSYIGLQLPLSFISEHWTKVKTTWDLLEIYIKQYDNILPFVTLAQAAEMQVADRKREVANILTAMTSLNEFLYGIKIEDRANMINSMNASGEF